MGNLRCLMMDLGGCITNDPIPTVLSGLASEHGLPSAKVHRVGEHVRRRFRHGPPSSIPPVERDRVENAFWHDTITRLAIPVSVPSLKQRLRSTIRLLDNRWPRFLGELSRQKIKLMIVSNNLAFVIEHQLKLGLRHLFHDGHVILSCDHGVSKSDPAGRLFQQALQIANVPRENCLFVDDRARNIELAVQAAGIPALHYQSHGPQGMDDLRSLIEARQSQPQKS